MVNVKYARKHILIFVLVVRRTEMSLVTLKNEGFSFLCLSPGVVNTRTAPPSAEEMKEIMEMGGYFKKHYPHWTGPMTPAASTKLMIGIIDNLTVEDSGKFLSHNVSTPFFAFGADF